MVLLLLEPGVPHPSTATSAPTSVTSSPAITEIPNAPPPDQIAQDDPKEPEDLFGIDYLTGGIQQKVIESSPVTQIIAPENPPEAIQTPEPVAPTSINELTGGSHSNLIEESPVTQIIAPPPVPTKTDPFGIDTLTGGTHTSLINESPVENIVASQANIDEFTTIRTVPDMRYLGFMGVVGAGDIVGNTSMVTDPPDEFLVKPVTQQILESPITQASSYPGFMATVGAGDIAGNTYVQDYVPPSYMVNPLESVAGTTAVVESMWNPKVPSYAGALSESIFGGGTYNIDYLKAHPSYGLGNLAGEVFGLVIGPTEGFKALRAGEGFLRSFVSGERMILVDTFKLTGGSMRTTSFTGHLLGEGTELAGSRGYKLLDTSTDISEHVVSKTGTEWMPERLIKGINEWIDDIGDGSQSINRLVSTGTDIELQRTIVRPSDMKKIVTISSDETGKVDVAKLVGVDEVLGRDIEKVTFVPSGKPWLPNIVTIDSASYRVTDVAAVAKPKGKISNLVYRLPEKTKGTSVTRYGEDSAKAWVDNAFKKYMTVGEEMPTVSEGYKFVETDLPSPVRHGKEQGPRSIAGGMDNFTKTVDDAKGTIDDASKSLDGAVPKIKPSDEPSAGLSTTGTPTWSGQANATSLEDIIIPTVRNKEDLSDFIVNVQSQGGKGVPIIGIPFGGKYNMPGMRDEDLVFERQDFTKPPIPTPVPPIAVQKPSITFLEEYNTSTGTVQDDGTVIFLESIPVDTQGQITKVTQSHEPFTAGQPQVARGSFYPQASLRGTIPMPYREAQKKIPLPRPDKQFAVKKYVNPFREQISGISTKSIERMMKGSLG